MKRFTAVLSVILILQLSACGAQKSYSETFLTVFDTATTVTGFCESEDEFNSRAKEIENELLRYHKLFDIYSEYEGTNNLKTVNEAAGRNAVEVDEELIDLLEFSVEMYEKTGGKTNIAMGSVLSLWHEARENGSYVPDAAALEAAAEHCDINSIVIDRDAGTVYISDPEATIDVGAVAKGFAVDRVCEYIAEQGWNNMAVSAGGNVKTVGGKASGEKWNIGIQNPDTESEQSYVALLELSDASLVTSGSYQRYYEVDGVRYHHIIDSETLMPKNEFVSVSVLCENAALADALSTALFCMSEAEGRELSSKLEVNAVWIYPDGSIVYTDGIDDVLEIQ